MLKSIWWLVAALGIVVAVLALVRRLQPPTGAVATRLPYRVRDDFLSPAEIAFFKVLQLAVGPSYLIFAKVRLADIFYVPNRNANLGHENRIRQKHIDFLLCHPDSLRPVLGIELDDSSHQRPTRRQRDHLVAGVFAAADLPLRRIPARRTYDVKELRDVLGPPASPANPRSTQPPEPGATLSQRPLALQPGAVPSQRPPVSQTVATPSASPSGHNPGSAPTPLPPSHGSRATPSQQTPDAKSTIPSASDPSPQCPKCGAPLVLRAAQRGTNRGTAFYGCSNYPRCRHTQPVPIVGGPAGG